MKYVLKELNNAINVTGIVNLHFFEFPTDFYTKAEGHPFFELVYVSSGKLFIKSDDYTGELEKGKIIIHRPNEIHSLSCLNKETPTVIILGFTCNQSDLIRFSKAPFSLSQEDIKKLAEIIKEGRNVFAPPYNVPIYDMKKRPNPIYGSEQMLKLLLEYFLIGILREQNRIYSLEEKEVPDKLSIAEIVNYLDSNYKEKITIDELSFIFRTNRSTLCKEFKNTMGKTIVEYINDKKLVKAKEKMKDRSKTLTSIAEELNFESIHYFTRFFKKLTGLSPKEYRNKFDK